MMLSEEQILDRLAQLPSFPSVLPRVQAELADPRCTAASLETIIRTDPAITANLLGIVNSAAYALPRQVESVRQAIALVGNKRVLELVTAAAYSRILPDELPGYRVDAAAFWTHCLAVAILSVRLRTCLPGSVQEEISEDGLFTAALLHDVGKIAICVFLGETMDEALVLLRGGKVDFRAAEAQLLGTDHCRVGARLARTWNLPDLVADVALWHHEPSAAPDDIAPTVALVHLANSLAHAVGLGADAGELAREVDEEAIGVFQIEAKDVEAAVSDAVLEVEAILAAATSATGEGA